MHQVVSKRFLMAICGGGHADPLPLLFRSHYHWNADKPEEDALWKLLEADPGADEALIRLWIRKEAARQAQDEAAL